ncbi:MAG: hypothetical protein AAGK32_13430, partial [Actinomycetota bacterium]
SSRSSAGPTRCRRATSGPTDDEVDAAGHLEDLPDRDECYVWIDAAHRGVGSASVGPDVALRHRVGPGRHRWSYRLRPRR